MLKQSVAIIAILLAKPAFAGPITLTPSEERRIDTGEIVTRIEESDEAVKTVTSVGRVRHPARDVYLLMTDFKNYPRIYNALESAQIESEALAHYRARMPWPLPGRSVSVATSLDPKQNAFSWRRVGGSIKTYQGELTAVPAGDRACTVFYSAKVDPGFEWLPSWFVTWGQSYVLPSIIHAIRDTLGKHQGPYWETGVTRPSFTQEPGN